jgi:hypothetical protein
MTSRKALIFILTQFIQYALACSAISKRLLNAALSVFLAAGILFAQDPVLNAVPKDA